LGGLLALGLATEVANADFIFGKPQNLGPVVNTASGDASNCTSADDLELYFASDRPGGFGDFDLWVSTRKSINDPWGPPVNLGAALNSQSVEGYPSLSSDGLTLYFSDAYFGPTRPGGLGGADIWMTTRASHSALWATPVNVKVPINSSSNELGPTISGDNLILIFGSNRAGGSGGYDLWMSTRASVQEPWGPPVNLGASVNSSTNDMECGLSADGLALFFCSNRGGGVGSYDLWMTTRKSRGNPWGQAVNLGPIVNSTADDSAPGVSSDMRTLYFNSSRQGGFGSYDLGEAPIIPILDFNSDEKVDLKDFSRLAQYWGLNESSVDMGPMPWGDGIVDAQDLTVLAEHWLEEFGLLAHWTLDETGGDVAHDSIQKLDGTLHGGPTWQPTAGKVRGALQLDGIDDYVSTPFILDPAGAAFAIFAWVKGGAPGQVVISQTGGMNWLLTDASEGKLMTELTIAGRLARPLTSQTIVTDGNWHRVGLTWDGKNRTLYVDDVEVAEDTQASLSGSQGGLHFGAGKNLDPGSFFSGLIDDVRIHSAALRTGSTTGL